MISAEKIAEVVNRIVQGYQPQRIILFGSYAAGKPHADSDLDLMVIKDEDRPPVERTREVSKLLRRTKVPVDLLVYTNKEYQQYKSIPHTIEYQVANNGKTIYMELNKPELIQEWLNKADEDLGTAKIVHVHMPDYKDTVSFHCQQAVEKYLKAYLIKLDVDFPKTHNLRTLLDYLSDYVDIDETWYDKAGELEFYAVHIRYPTGRYNPSEVRDKEALKAAEAFRKWLLPQIKRE